MALAARHAAAAGELPRPEFEAVGGWWNRQFDREIDLIGADRRPIAQQILFAGSIKWLATPFDAHDLADLTRDATQVSVESGVVQQRNPTPSAGENLFDQWHRFGQIVGDAEG